MFNRAHSPSPSLNRRLKNIENQFQGRRFRLTQRLLSVFLLDALKANYIPRDGFDRIAAVLLGLRHEKQQNLHLYILQARLSTWKNDFDNAITWYQLALKKNNHNPAYQKEYQTFLSKHAGFEPVIRSETKSMRAGLEQGSGVAHQRQSAERDMSLKLSPMVLRKQPGI